MPPAQDAAFAVLSDPRVRREPAARIARALARLHRAAARDPKILLRLHDRLLFLLAYPPSRAIRKRCEALLRDVSRLVAKLEAADADMALFDDPEVAGVAGTTITTDFSFDLARYLLARHRGRVSIDWGGADSWDRARASWPEFVPLLEEESLADANVPYTAWLRTATGNRESDLGWLLARYERLSVPSRDRAEHWDALGVPLAWNLGDSPASRTRMRRPGPPVFFHKEPLLARRDVSLDAIFAEPPLPVRRLSRREGERVCDMVRDATAARYREFYTFTFADPSSVLAARPGRGLEIFLMGVLPERRLPLRSAYGGFFVKNGVPVGYIEGLAFFERLEIGFNIYYAFREGESAWIYAHVLKLHRDALGVTSFSIDPYQLGFENEEAIDSGAFWFYRKLGLPADRPGGRRARRARGAPDEGGPRVPVVAADARRPRDAQPPVRSPGHARGGVGPVPRAEPGPRRRPPDGAGVRGERGEAARILRAARRPPARMAGARGGSSALDRKAFSDYALVLAGIPDLARWSKEERRGVVEVIRAKAGGSERRYLRLLQRHRGCGAR